MRHLSSATWYQKAPLPSHNRVKKDLHIDENTADELILSVLFNQRRGERAKRLEVVEIGGRLSTASWSGHIPIPQDHITARLIPVSGDGVPVLGICVEPDGVAILL